MKPFLKEVVYKPNCFDIFLMFVISMSIGAILFLTFLKTNGK